MAAYHQFTHDWNMDFYDDLGKPVREGNKSVKYTHDKTFEILLRLIIYRTKNKNEVNKMLPKADQYNVSKPQEYYLNTIDIKNFAGQQSKRGITQPTIKEHLKRLVLAGVLLKGGEYYCSAKRAHKIVINPAILCLKTGKDGEIIKKSGFSSALESVNCKNKSRETQDYSNIKLNNKKRHSKNVNKKDLVQEPKNNSLNQEHLKITRSPNADLKKWSKKICAIFEIEDQKNHENELRENLKATLSPRQEQELAGDVKDALHERNVLKIKKLQVF